MTEKVKLEKSACVKAAVDTAKGLKLKIKSIEEDMELLEQVIVDHMVVSKGSIEELQIRLSSIEEELGELGSTAKKEMLKLIMMIKDIRGIIRGGLKWCKWMENELDEGKFRKEEHEQNNI